MCDTFETSFRMPEDLENDAAYVPGKSNGIMTESTRKTRNKDILRSQDDLRLAF